MPVTKRMMVGFASVALAGLASTGVTADAQLASNAAGMCCGIRPGATSMASKRMS
jgi:hypothetical protein